ncbi:MAG: hypothetical protein GWM88_04215 [Pseudomonadales bacterium]|nr:hypothetical protein [Pseudomonadales bacterium]NIX07258.1 hypothetical protein [Pseudomonadales bacterium]
MRRAIGFLILSTMTTVPAWAGDKLEAAIGGGAGGAVGAVVGDELGDRKGAIIGSAVGAAIGTAIATDGNDESHGHDHDHQQAHSAPAGTVHVEVGSAGGHPAGRHCPPGQAKKGRC